MKTDERPDAEWRAQVEQWLAELRAEPIISTPTEYERGYDHAMFEVITRLTALLAVSSPPREEMKEES